MAARLRANEAGAKAMRRIARSEAGKAIEGLRERWPPPDEAIHDARKRIKKARAALRLFRTALGEREFRRENVAFRDAARPLSEIRDAKILIDALDRYCKPATANDRQNVESLRGSLMTSRMGARRRVVGTQEKLEPVIETLRAARRGVAKPGGAGWSVVGSGLRRVYRSGRRAFAKAVEQPTDGNLHEWRKQAKYLWHALEFIEPIHPAPIGKMAGRVHQLTDRLGDDHDLAVLRARIARTRSLPADAVDFFQRAIDRPRRRLQAQAIQLGRRVYEQKPRDYVRRLGRDWKTWRRSGA